LKHPRNQGRFRIRGWKPQPARQPPFAEVVSDDFSLLDRQRLLLIIQNRLPCGVAQFNLFGHLLQARSERINLLLLRVNLATCFEKFIEQHRVHGFVSHCARFSFFVW
jgi:hypothetical protein